MAVVLLCAGNAARAQEAGAAGNATTQTSMANGADPDWEVLTVRPSDPNATDATFDVRGRHVIVGNRTVETMLLLAYGLQKNQIVGGPDWIRSQHFDADGIPNVEGQPSLDQFRGLLRKLLGERFGLKSHMEQRELLVYAMTVARGGPSMTESKADPNALQTDADNQSGGQRSIHMTNATMPGLALELLYNTDRPVLDRTGLTGKYDFTLRWTYDDSKVSADASAPPDLFKAMQEQLGLKLDALKTPANVLVIDAAERPDAN